MWKKRNYFALGEELGGCRVYVRVLHPTWSNWRFVSVCGKISLKQGGQTTQYPWKLFAFVFKSKIDGIIAAPFFKKKDEGEKLSRSFWVSFFPDEVSERCIKSRE